MIKVSFYVIEIDNECIDMGKEDKNKLSTS